MEILITGANSPLGRVVVERALLSNHRVVEGVREIMVDEEAPPHCKQIKLDMTKPETFSGIPKSVECVVHIAAANDGPAEHLFDVNGLGTMRLLKFSLPLAVSKIIHVSSMSVYGTVTERIVRRDSKIQHPSPYGLSKFMGECFLVDFANEIASVSIRSPAIIGNGASRNFLARMVRDMMTGQKKITLKNPDFLFNNVIHYKSLAHLIISLAEADLTSHDYFPVASSNPMPLSTVVEHIANRLEYRGQISWFDGAPIPFSIDTEYAEKLGFKPKSVLDEIDDWLNSDPITL